MVDLLELTQLLLCLVLVQLNDETLLAADESLLDLFIALDHLVLLHVRFVSKIARDYLLEKHIVSLWELLHFSKSYEIAIKVECLVQVHLVYNLSKALEVLLAQQTAIFSIIQ